MDAPWLEVLSTYQTTICVFLIVLSVSILWIYVTVIRGKVVEPNFDILYEKSSQPVAGNKKLLKTKVKGKHVDGSPRPGKGKPVMEAGGTVLPQAKEKAPSKENKQPTPKTRNGNKKQAGRRKNQEEVVRGVKGNNTRVSESSLSQDNENDGEWQTQLSRPQLRALRQKQRKIKGAGDAGIQSGVDSGREGSSGGDGRWSEKEVVSGSSSKRQKKKNKGKQEARGSPDLKVQDKSVSADVAEETTQLSDTGVSGPDLQEVSSTDGVAPTEGVKQEATASSTSAPVTCNSSVLDLETALRDAAICSGSASKNENASSSQVEPEGTKTSQKRKRNKRKAKQEEDDSSNSSSKKTPAASKDERASSVGRDSSDDWVVID